jgi:uncharacterized protein YqeY
VTPEPAPGRADAAQALRAALRQGLTSALKARDHDALAVLRTTIAAIDNAEAVPALGTNPSATSVHVAGSSGGLGSTEAARRQLSASELRDILRAQITEHTREADRYDALGQSDAAERLRRRARTLTAYLC